MNEEVEWIFLGVVFVVGVVFTILTRKRRMQLLKNCGIPGPRPNFWSGNLRECFSMGNVEFDTMLTQKYGDICGYYLGAKPIILVSDPVLLKVIQVEQASTNFRSRPRRVPGGINPDPKRREMLGNLPPHKWLETRKVLTKAFTPSKLRDMLPQVQDKIDIFLNQVVDALHTGPLDFYPLLQALTLDIIGQTGFGVSCHIQENLQDPLHLAVQSEFAKSPNSLLVKFYLCLPELAWLLQPLRVLLYKGQEKLGHTESSELWDQGFATFKERTKDNAEERADILQQLLNSHLREEPLRVVANSVLFFEAAYETLSSSTAFIIHLLTKHGEVQRKVREELVQVVGEGGLLTYDHLNKLKYMEQVIKEGLRMYPPQTTFIGRSGDRDLVYERGTGERVVIPAGVHIQAGLYQLHHNPQFWPNPGHFDPERFAGNNGKGAECRGEWQAFGLGPRVCIGQQFGWMVLKLVLGNLLLHYQLDPCPQTEEQVTLHYKIATMTPAKGSWAQPLPLKPQPHPQ